MSAYKFEFYGECGDEAPAMESLHPILNKPQDRDLSTQCKRTGVIRAVLREPKYSNKYLNRLIFTLSARSTINTTETNFND